MASSLHTTNTVLSKLLLPPDYLIIDGALYLEYAAPDLDDLGVTRVREFQLPISFYALPIPKDEEDSESKFRVYYTEGAPYIPPCEGARVATFDLPIDVLVRSAASKLHAEFLNAQIFLQGDAQLKAAGKYILFSLDHAQRKGRNAHNIDLNLLT